MSIPDLLLYLTIRVVMVVALFGVLAVLSGAAQIVWDAVHQRAKRKRASKT